MIARLLILLLACGALCSCASTNGGGKAETIKCQDKVVSSLWRTRIDVVQRALDDWDAGRRMDGVKLYAAVSELVDLSGIEGPAPNYVGYIPGDELRRSLEAWQQWFREHGGCLRFNEETGSLERSRPCLG